MRNDKYTLLPYPPPDLSLSPYAEVQNPSRGFCHGSRTRRRCHGRRRPSFACSPSPCTSSTASTAGGGLVHLQPLPAHIPGGFDGRRRLSSSARHARNPRATACMHCVTAWSFAFLITWSVERATAWGFFICFANYLEHERNRERWWELSLDFRAYGAAGLDFDAILLGGDNCSNLLHILKSDKWCKNWYNCRGISVQIYMFCDLCRWKCYYMSYDVF